VILLVDSTAPEAIEQYGIRVADAWKIGRGKVDDGVILLVAKNNPAALRRLRIEAGRGVQGSLTDAQSKRVLEDVIAPYFRKNDYYGGLNAGVAAISTLLGQENLPAAAQSQTPDGADSSRGHDQGSWLGGLLPLLIFAVFALASRMRGRGAGNNLNHNNWGSAAGVVLGGMLSQSGRGGGFGGGGFGSSGGSGGGFSGGGGGFDGGGASGDW
jgi:uncharacterized protein